MGRLHAPAARRAEFPRAGHAAARAGAGARPRQPRGRRGADTRLRRAGLRLTTHFRAGGLRGCGGRDRPEVPARAVARPRRTHLYLRPLPHAFAAAARYLPRPGAAVRQGVELGRTGPQRQRRLPGLRGGRAQTRRRHRRRGDAARAAVRGADVVHALAALLALAVFLPSIWLYYGLVRNRINRYGELENKAQRERRGSWPRPSAAMPTSRSTMPSR